MTPRTLLRAVAGQTVDWLASQGVGLPRRSAREGDRMQSFMIRLEGMVRRRRAFVLAAWAAVLVAAVPLAAHQSDRLTGGGFGVPGSQSRVVSEQLDRDFAGAERATLAAVVVPGRDATPAQARAAVLRLAKAAATRRWSPCAARIAPGR